MNVTEVMPAAPPQSSLRKGVNSAPGEGSTNYDEGFPISLKLFGKLKFSFPRLLFRVT